MINLLIDATPVLYGKDADKFFDGIEEGVEKPSKLIATPGLGIARALVRKYDEARKRGAVKLPVPDGNSPVP